METQVGRKDDKDKLKWHLLPMKLLEPVVKVLSFGAKRYGEYNWQNVSNPKERYSNAAMRHLIAYSSGESIDDDSRLPHLAHLICCALFLMWFDSKDGKLHFRRLRRKNRS